MPITGFGVVQEAIKFKDEYGPAAECPLQERYDDGELEGARPRCYMTARYPQIEVFNVC